MTTLKRSGDPLPGGPPAPTGGDPAGRVPPGCHPSVPLHAAVSEGDFATRVQVYRVQADPRRSRCFCPGHFEPLKKKKKTDLGRGFCPCRRVLGFPQKQKRLFIFFSFFSEPCSGPGASRLCAGCSGGTSWRAVSPPSFPAGAAPAGSRRAARPAGKLREMGARLNPKPVIERSVGKISV